jgi:ABC-2 type transport system ATP-binding protein
MVLIQVTRLTKRFGEREALRDVSFTLRPGEATGYLGPNGAGKSTTIKMLTGLLRPDNGTIQVCGHDLAASPLEVKRRLGYVPDNAVLYETLSPHEYLSLVAELHHLEGNIAAERIRSLFADFDLSVCADRAIETLSRGQRQKVIISAALIHDPEVLLLDEPLNGLDVNAALAFRRLIETLVARGKTVLFTSHILEVIERLCQRTIVIHQGSIVADEPTRELMKRSGSLEAVFRQLTRPNDAADEARAFLRALDKIP